MNYAEDDLIPLSALQHLLFCERQCALIHTERLWEENQFTAEGRIMHSRTDEPVTEMIDGTKVARALRIRSFKLGVVGVCDVVEFQNGIPTPVEYKRGKPKSHRADEVQVCAQAMCLEEMLDVGVQEAYLFYGRTRRRHHVVLDDELRDLTEDIADRCHDLIVSGETPAPQYERRKCSACSLALLCMPRQNWTADVDSLMHSVFGKFRSEKRGE